MSEQPAANAPAPPRPAVPRKRRKRIIRLLAILALVLAALVLAAPWIVARTGLRDRTLNTILNSPSVEASSESASFGWFSPLAVDGLGLQSSNKRVDIRVGHISTERSPLRLWTSSPDFGTVRVDKVQVRLELPLDLEAIGPGRRLEPAFTAIATDGTLTVNISGGNEPALDVDEINMTFRVERTEAGEVLTLDPLVVFDRRKLTPKLVKSLIYLFDPTISDTPQMSGEFSLSLDKLRVPIGISRDQAAARIEIEGKLVLHHLATEIKNPVRRAIVELVADMNGKHASDVVRLVLGTRAGAVAIGLATGLAASVAASTLLRSFLFGLSGIDPMTYAAVAAILIVASLLAAYLPARRATRIDPLVALRYE